MSVALGDVWKARMPAWALCAREAFESLAPHAHLLEPLGEDVLNVLRLGESVTARAAEDVRALRRSLGTELRARLDALGISAFALPTHPFTLPAPEVIGSWPMLFPDVRDTASDAAAGYTPVASLLGWPALSLPSDTQLVGLPGAENLLVETAQRLFV